MAKVLVVGSGASGVHFAMSALQKGHHVVMLDVGWEKNPPANPGDTINQLKENLSDPAQYFLGQNYQAVVYPGSDQAYYTRYYGFPPSKSSIFSQPSNFDYQATGFQPLLSFSQGGLAEAWTAGVYPMNDAEMAEFPFDYTEIGGAYDEVARRMGINGADDDLVKFFPYHRHMLAPLRLDEHSQMLVAAYEKQKHTLNRQLRGYLGRSRVGTLSADTADRAGCTYCGRCLWGCPTESLYTPSITLKVCLKHPNFEYVSGVYVNHFTYENGRITALVAQSVQDHTWREFTGDRYVLAAGALSSSKIFMESVFKATGKIIKLPGLMDNRQILVPFVNLRMLGKSYNPESYQYHQLAVGLENDRPEEYIHGQITTLKSALVHPIIQNVPFDWRTSTYLFKNMRASLAVVNLNLWDRRRPDNFVTIEPQPDVGYSRLLITYQPDPAEAGVIKQAVSRLKKMLWKLGCVVPPGMVHVRPMGASVHYAGTIPMSAAKAPLTTSKDCQSHDFENLYIVDGTTFPFLPAKNITYSLMANAVRVAEHAF